MVRPVKEYDGSDSLRHILDRFPNTGARIRELFQADEQFRELCGDYAECMAILDRLRQGQGAADERVEQYCELRVNLETELMSQISASTEGSDPSSCTREPDTAGPASRRTPRRSCT